MFLGHLKKDQLNRMGMSNVHYSKTGWITKIINGLKGSKQGYKKEALPTTKDFRYATKTRRFYVCYIFGFKHGILTNVINTVC
jgi:hypothetical protein